jgi:uncharacterized membrane protein YkoI
MMRAVFLGFVVAGAAAPAAADTICFAPDEAREQVAKHGLIALHDVVRSARGGAQADLISARLCETSGNMVYMIAMLGRDGKVARLIVDARTGDLITTR